MPNLMDRAAVADAIEKSRRVVTVRASWETQDKLREWAKSYGFDLGWSYSGWPQSSYDFDFHVTIVASANKVAIEDGVRMIDPITVTPDGFDVMGDNTPVITLEQHATLTAIREFFVSAFGVEPTYAELKPHISLSYKWTGEPDIRTSAPALPDFPLVFDLMQVARLDDAPPEVKIEREVGDAGPRRKTMHASDVSQIKGTRRSKDGYLVTDARVARGGNIQDYYGREIGEGQPNQVFKVWRPEDEIFRADSLATFAHKPVTLGHPTVQVTPESWRRDAIGHVGSEVVRDGEFVRVPLVVMDQAAINAIEDGTREISMGYDCELVMEAGTTPDGRAYDAYQKNIRINHCAIVPAGRAGPQCRIGDSAPRSNQQEGKTMAKSVTIDGKTFEVADNVAALIADGKIQEALVASAKVVSDAQAALTTANARADVAEKLAKDTKAELDDLKAKQPTADAISKIASDLVDTIETAKAIAPKVETKGKTADAIKSDVVIAAIGDTAKGKDAAYYAAAFDMLAKAKTDADPVAAAIKSAADAGGGTVDAAVKKANDDYDAWLTNSWAPKSAA